ncbi:MAG: 4-hydroxy-tetrahydrodipicolinate synthase, partial [Gammaproteobacteria bacterium]|nr:4-hydroxy-tetrahydrodipicolinate synthase [Gammaproteobacteria bacterium]
MSAKPTPTFRGAMTALVTPFDERGSVDLEAVERLARWQV